MRNYGVPAIIATIGLLIASVLAGCQSTGGTEPNQAALEDATCPEGLQDRVKVAGSAVPLEIPQELAHATEATEYNGQVARRVIVSVAPGSAVQGAKVFSSTLAISTVGGVFAGWATLDHSQERSKAVDVIPGRLRVQPFFNSKSLHAQTMTVDMLVKPGSTPLDELAIGTSSLWSDKQLPTRPEDLRLTFTPLRHMTVFDVVDARLTLDITASSAHTPWHCSFESRVELIDRASVLPALWGLRKTGLGSAQSEWLALNDPTTGPFRAVFTNPEAARGFANWLRATRAIRIEKYVLGLFPLKDSDRRTPPAVTPPVAASFHGISREELEVLDVKRLGE